MKLVDDKRMAARLVDSLYTEAMVLADEARAYFDEHGRADRDSLPPMDRVAFACESLKVTTRLMHIIAWLLTRRAVDAGEIPAIAARSPGRKLGQAAETDPGVAATMPPAAQSLIESSIDLYDRVGRLDRDLDSPGAATSPARSLMSRLERAF